MDEVFTGNSSIVKWKDNKVLNIASNKFMKDPVKKLKYGPKHRKDILKLTCLTQSKYTMKIWGF